MNKYVAVFTNKRMLVTLLLGFSGGLPLALCGATMQAWLADAKVDIATIGQFSLIGLPYSMKFLWAPFIDNIKLPYLGLRRGWMVTCQFFLFLATVALGFIDPASSIGLFSICALFIAFFSASQDIVIDAYRTEIIEDQKEVGAGAGTYITGYRIAMVVSGGAALVLADYTSWTMVYFVMALLNLVGMATILASPEPSVVRKRNFAGFKESIVIPFSDFFQKSGAMEILIFIMVYKVSTLMATALTTNFLLEIGNTKTLIGTVNKGAGLIATIAGTLMGGTLMIKFGLKRSLWTFGIVQSLVGLTFCILSRVAVGEYKGSAMWLFTIISLDNFMMGLGTAALTGFMMSFCSKQFTGTQYALLTSVMATARVILIAHAGTLVKVMGWDLFFISTVPLAIPGLLLLSRFDTWQTSVSQEVTSKGLSTYDRSMIFLFIGSLILLSSDPFWQFMKMKEEGKTAALAGAVGVLLLVGFGLLRPLLSKKDKAAVA